MATNKTTSKSTSTKAAAPAKSKITSAKQAERDKVTAQLRKELGISEGLCLSGSGQVATERFAPGGDAKLKSQFLNQYRSGNATLRAKAVKLATLLCWEARLTDAKPKPVKAAKPAKPAKAAKAAKPAKVADTADVVVDTDLDEGGHRPAV